MVDITVSPAQVTLEVAPAQVTLEIGKGPTGAGLPTGGAIGAMPAKRSAADFDMEWKQTGAVGLSILALSALTAGSLLLGAGAGAPTELATTAIGRSLLTAADVAAARSALGLGVSNSPTFAGLTSTDTIWATNGTVQAILSFGATTGNIGTASAHALALITGGSQRVNIGTDGVATFYGAAPGTPGAGEARIGGGSGKFYGAVHAGNPSAIHGTDNGLVVGGDIEIARDGVGGTQRHGRIRSVPGASYAGGIAFDRYYYNGSSYVFGEVLRLDDAANATFSGNVFVSSVAPHQYIDRSASGSPSGVVFRDASASPTRKSWFAGVQNNVDDGWELTPSTTNGGTTFSTPVLRIPSTGLATFYSATAPGTPAANQVLIGGGAIKTAGAITVADDFVGASTSGYYFGDRLTDGTWRLRLDGSDLVLEHRQSGSYVEASRWVPPV